MHQAGDAIAEHLAGDAAAVEIHVARRLVPAVVDDLPSIRDHP